ncbi:PrsW family intramembrane metalloprotease [Streptomyces sp. NPDC093085]|uniref:PrsW family intramembrane metalloprotease n=1 Tax=Streptomyces sp. NPDC093085 TaxID=3155068 RepID=UPI0034297B35
MTAPATAPPAPSRIRSLLTSVRSSWRQWPAVWAFTVLCLIGLFLLLRDFGPVIRVFPGSALLALVLLAVTLGIGEALLSRLRPFRAPPPLWAWSGILWGATAAAGCAVTANTGLQGVWYRTAGIGFGAEWAAALTAPLNEELLKVCGVALIALAARPLVRGPLDGFFLGAFTGLGFQAMENWTYAMNALLLGGGVDGTTDIAQSFVTRVGVTGLGSHWAMTAVSGTGVGILLAHDDRPMRRRIAPAAGCLLTAMGMHWLFDSPLLGSTGGLVAKVAVNFLIALGFALVLRHRARRRARAFLLSPGTPLSIDLLTRRSRRDALLRLEPARRPAAEQRASAYLGVVEEQAVLWGRPSGPSHTGDP